MKPSGSASAKKRRSAAVSDSPAHPRIVAPGPSGSCGLAGSGPDGSGCDDDATDIACLELAAEHVRQGLLAQWPRLEPVVDAAAAEVDALDLRFQTAQQVRIGLARTLPGGARLGLRPQRGDLDAIATRARRLFLGRVRSREPRVG